VALCSISCGSLKQKFTVILLLITHNGLSAVCLFTNKNHKSIVIMCFNANVHVNELSCFI